MKRVFTAGLLLALLAAGGCASVAPQQAPADDQPAGAQTTPAVAGAAEQPGADPDAAPTAQRPVGLTNGLVVADARVIPVRSIETSFQVPGVVAEILVQEGDRVTAGAPLMRLDEGRLQLNIDEARATLAEAKAYYEQASAGADPEELAVAQARLEEAMAELQSTTGAVVSEDVKAAQAELDANRAELARLQAGPKSADLKEVQAEIDEARASLQAVRDRYSHEKTLALSAVEEAADVVRQRQAEYSAVYWELRRTERSRPLNPQEVGVETRVTLALQIAETNLEQAKIAYDQAVQQEINQIAIAETRVTAAEANLEQLLAPVDADAIARVRARIAASEAKLAQLQGDRREGTLNASEANVEIAQANLDRIAAGPRSAELATAEARLMRAEVDLKRAELELSHATLRAPIDGVVARVGATVGQTFSNNAAAAVTIADTSAWMIQTANLNELAVVSVREGDPVSIAFYALPGFELTGRVEQIQPVGSSVGRDTVYTVLIKPDAWDDRLRWNMTASIRITPQ